MPSYLHYFTAPLKLQALQCCLLSNNAKRTTEIYWIFSNIRQVGGHCTCAQNMKSILYLADNFRHCVVCPLAQRSWGQLFEHPSWASASDCEPSRAQDKLQPRGSAWGDGRIGQGRRGVRGKWAHQRVGSPVLNNYCSSTQSGWWKCCLNGVFKGLISIAVEKAGLISLSSLLRPPLWALIACSKTYTFCCALIKLPLSIQIACREQ